MEEPESQIRQAIIDEEHLRLLSMGYYVSAALSAFFSFFGLVYAFVGVFISGVIQKIPHRAGQELPPEFVGWLLSAIGIGITLFMLGAAAIKFMVGRQLTRHRSRTFCIVVAALCCFGIPYGTILGVLSLMVLTRPSVTRLFASGPPTTR